MNPELEEYPPRPWEKWADRWLPRFIIGAAIALVVIAWISA